MKHALTKYREDATPPLTLDGFAGMIGASKSMVWKWENGKAVPRQGYMQKIINVTAGQVTPNDWYQQEAAE